MEQMHGAFFLKCCQQGKEANMIVTHKDCHCMKLVKFILDKSPFLYKKHIHAQHVVEVNDVTYA